jgi:hypothetical protein
MQRAIIQTVTILVVTAGTLGGLQRAGRTQERPAAPPPRIAAVTPAEPGRSDTPQVLMVQGANFAEGLSLTVTTPAGAAQKFQGQDIRERKADSFQVAVVLATAGTYSLTVTNPDGTTSAPYALSVQATQAAAPMIDRVMPESVPRDTRPQDLVVEGRRFEQGLKVTIEMPDGQSIVVQGDQVRDLTPTSFKISVVLDMQGTHNLFVANPSGAKSNAVPIAVSVRR